MIDIEPVVQAAAVTGVVGIIVELMRRQNKAHKAICEVKEHAEAARTQVQNSHKTNLRDDLDKVIDGLGDVKELLRDQAKDINGLREEIRHERVERVYVEKRLDDHLRMHG